MTTVDESSAVEADEGAPDAPVDDGADSGDDHRHHEPTDNNYIVIALILAVITAAEVAASYLDLGALFIPLLLVMMAIKFFVVVSFFMHLRFDNRIFTWIFYGGLVLALAVYIAALATFRFFGN